MIRRTRLMWAAAALTAVLGACHRQDKASHGEVTGQILPGSVSDAMLPYDAVKSKAPLAPAQPADTGDNGPADEADSANMAASADSTVPDAVASPGTGPAAVN